MTHEIPHVVISKQGMLATLNFVDWRECNIRPTGKLPPIYEWKLLPTPFVIPARWKVSLPTNVYLDHLTADGEELDPQDLPQDTVWEVCTGYLPEDKQFQGSLNQVKNLLLGRFLSAFGYEIDTRQRSRRMSPRRVFVKHVK